MDNLMLATRSEGYLDGTTAMMGYYEAATEEAMLRDVHVPTLILWGVLDKNKTPEELARLRAGLHNSTAVKIPDAGHFVHEEGVAESADGLIINRNLWQ